MSGPVIVLENVSKDFGGMPAVTDLSFSVAREEIVALLGRTGAGKSTALHMVMGVMPASSGRVRVLGKDPHHEFDALRGKLAVSFQTDRLLPWCRAWENVAVGMRILGIPAEQRRRRAVHWLERVKITGDENTCKYPHEMSGGMRQRASLARALAVDPDLILLDESFSQLDHVTSSTLRRDFAALVRDLRKTCLLITHRIDDALEMADRILVLAAPARVALEIRIDSSHRADPGWMALQHEAIAAAMAGEAPAVLEAENI